jgi:NDP-sugar pyrophosphorylase family protein
MLMAAGLGTRLKPFTDMEPKALIPVMGIPCAQFAIDSLMQAGVRSIVANLHHQAEKARAGLLGLDLGGAALTLSDESQLLLGSAGGIAKALSCFENEPFFLVNADVLCGVDLRKLALRHALLRERFGVTLTLTVFPRSEGNGSYREIFLDENSREDCGLIQGLGEVVSERPYFVGAAVVEPEALAGISGEEPSEFVPRVLNPAIQQKKAAYYLTAGHWFDVGSPRLWHVTHRRLIEELETGNLPRTWRLRIEKVNKRIAQQAWISRGARREFRTASWSSPAYFNHLGDSTAQPPHSFGPNAVLYGDAHSYAGEFSQRIGYRGLFEKV